MWQLASLCNQQIGKHYLEHGVVNASGKGQVVLNVEEHAWAAIGVRQICFFPVHKPNQWRYCKAQPQIASFHSVTHLRKVSRNQCDAMGGQAFTQPRSTDNTICLLALWIWLSLRDAGKVYWPVPRQQAGRAEASIMWELASSHQFSTNGQPTSALLTPSLRPGGNNPVCSIAIHPDYLLFLWSNNQALELAIDSAIGKQWNSFEIWHNQLGRQGVSSLTQLTPES